MLKDVPCKNKCEHCKCNHFSRRVLIAAKMMKLKVFLQNPLKWRFRAPDHILNLQKSLQRWRGMQYIKWVNQSFLDFSKRFNPFTFQYVQTYKIHMQYLKLVIDGWRTKEIGMNYYFQNDVWAFGLELTIKLCLKLSMIWLWLVCSK